jgi:hypothetical protein
MELGFKRWFRRKRSKGKPLLISAPLPDTFRQTAGYEESNAGPPPTIGNLPIKPSEQVLERKSFSHSRTKSVGLQEFSQAVRTDSSVRPRTAPGAQTPPLNPFNPSSLRRPDHISQDDRLLRVQAVPGPPKVPDLPKDLAEMDSTKYFDLLHAAVSTSKSKVPPESTQSSSDFYNESIADRNSLYGKPPKLSANKGASKAFSSHGGINASQPRNDDTQRASFDAMRASRNARRSVDVEATFSEKDTKQGQSPSKGKSAQDVVTPQTPSNGRRSTRNSFRRTELGPQLSPIPQEKSSPAAAPAESCSPSSGSKPLPIRQRSKTVGAVPTREYVSDTHQVKSSAVLTLNPFKDESQQSVVNDGVLVPSIPHILSRNRSSSASGNPLTGKQALGTHPNDTLPRMSSDRPSHKNASRMILCPPGRAMDIPALPQGKRPDEDDDNDYDVGIEEAVAQQADPVQILRASVVSAKGYVYKGGDNVILGKVLHHRPSRGLSQAQSNGIPTVIPNDNLNSKSKAKNDTSASIKAHSRVPSIASDVVSQFVPDQIQSTSIRTIASQSVPEETAANASLRVPPRGPAEARTTLPTWKHLQSPPPSHGNMQVVASRQNQASSLTSSTAEAPPPYSPPTPASPAAVEHQASLPLTNGNKGSVPNSPIIFTRDFAHPETPPRAYRSETTKKSAADIINGIIAPISGRGQSGIVGGYIHLTQKELEYQSTDLDRSIAIKKEAAAKALLKLQAVMAMPTWEEPDSAGLPRKATTKVPNHWRGLSIEDGSPIAPSAIFQKVKIPLLPPPLSRHSTFSRHGTRELRQSSEAPIGGNTEVPPANPPWQASKKASLSKTQKEYIVASEASLESIADSSWLDLRGRSETAMPSTRGSHSRMSSAVSTTSGTSVYSLPYHMVPARGSSMRDSDGSIGDFSGSPRFHVGELGWQ